MILFRRRRNESIQERKLALTSQVEQLKKELDNKSGEDDRQSLDYIVNSMVSAHLTENPVMPNKYKRTRG